MPQLSPGLQEISNQIVKKKFMPKPPPKSCVNSQKSIRTKRLDNNVQIFPTNSISKSLKRTYKQTTLPQINDFRYNSFRYNSSNVKIKNSCRLISI